MIRTRAPDPFGLYGLLTGRSRQRAVADRTGRLGDSPALTERLARWVRGNLFVPDARVGWVPFALVKARSVYRRRRPDIILTTGPPHSVHLIGRNLKRAWGIPWVADFRDPWTDIHYVGDLGRSRASETLDTRMERSVLYEADGIVTIGSWLQRDLEARTTTPVHLIRNGFDAEDFAANPQPVSTQTFDLIYVGSLFGVPESVLDAVVLLRSRGETPHLRIRFIGEQPDGLADTVAERDLGSIVTWSEPVPHDKAVAAMANAGLLLLTIETDWSYAEGVIPGKTYEYLASGRPILGVGPPNGDAATILRNSGGGNMLAPGDVEGIATMILDHYAAWEKGRPHSGAPWEVALGYSRREGTRALSQIVASLCDVAEPDHLRLTHPARE